MEALRLVRISDAFAFSKFCLDVHQQMDALSLDFLCVLLGRRKFLVLNDDREKRFIINPISGSRE